MTVRLTPTGIIQLHGACPSEDAEMLLRHLLTDPTAVVEWQACESAHTAVIQVLLFAKPTLQGIPSGKALRDWVQPLLLSLNTPKQQ